MTNTPPHKWQWFHTVSVIVIVLVIILIGSSIIPWSLTKGNPASTLGTWWIIMILLTLFVFITGHGITGSVFGALIDEQNKMSLARLQLVIWTIVILSALLTAALWNIVINKADPLGIALPNEVWLLLGISTTSLVGTPLVLDPKKGKPPNQREVEQQFALKARLGGKSLPASFSTTEAEGGPKLHEKIDEYRNILKVNLKGQVSANESFDQASLGDLFKGDEVGNFVQLDMSKIQLFLFTVILVLTYTVALGTMFASLKIDPSNPMKGITSFPALDQSMIVLLGISHAGYLTHEAIPHSTPPTSTLPAE